MNTTQVDSRGTRPQRPRRAGGARARRRAPARPRRLGGGGRPGAAPGPAGSTTPRRAGAGRRRADLVHARTASRCAPLYTADDVAELPDVGVPGVRPFVRGAGRGGAVPDGWDVRTMARRPRPARPARRSSTDLANGATSIWLAVGAPAPRSPTCPTALDGVLLDLAPVVLDASASPAPTTRRPPPRRTWSSGPRASARPRCAARWASTPSASGPGPDRARTSGPSSRSRLRVAREFPLVRAVVVDGLPVHVAGGSDAQELGYVARRRRRLPARAHRRRARRRRRRPAAGAAARRHRRPVPDDREAARRPPPVGAGAGGERGGAAARRRRCTPSPRRRCTPAATRT